MESEDPLSQLADIHLPTAISWWPPAPGWWILAGLFLIFLGLLARQWLLINLRRQRRDSALRELQGSYQRFTEASTLRPGEDQPGLNFLGETNAVLRRVALVFFPREDITTLTGSRWLAFLDKVENTQEFSEGPGRALGEAAYQSRFDADAESIYHLSRNWVRKRYLALDKPELFPGLKWKGIKRQKRRSGRPVSGIRQ